MCLIGVTGHVHVDGDVAQWVVRALHTRLVDLLPSPIHGVTCLAKGADQIFARAVLAVSGTFDVVLPAHDYEQAMVRAGDGEEFRELLDRASTVRTMPFETSSRTAYLAASEEMLDRCELLLAVWDGEPSRNLGDTAHVVEVARRRDLPVEVIWPSRGAGRPGEPAVSGRAATAAAGTAPPPSPRIEDPEPVPAAPTGPPTPRCRSKARRNGP
jgi:hypothetical protein